MIAIFWTIYADISFGKSGDLEGYNLKFETNDS
jgi:hypothetical protein